MMLLNFITNILQPNFYIQSLVNKKLSTSFFISVEKIHFKSVKEFIVKNFKISDPETLCRL